MEPRAELDELADLLRAEVPVILVETHEEPRLLDLVQKVASLTDQALYTWSIANGIARQQPRERVSGTHDLVDALKHIDTTPQNGIYVLCDAHPGFKDPVCQRLIREIALEQHRTRRTLVFIGPETEGLPPAILRLAVHFRPALPDREQIRRILAEEAALHESRSGVKARGSRELIDKFVLHLAGMESEDVRRHVRQALRADGALDDGDLRRMLRTKYEALGRDGALEFVDNRLSFDDLGGMHRLKAWISLRHAPLLESAADDPDRPKGVLLFGVQGGGKSLAARAIAGQWGLPLLHMDFGTLYNKFHGETERNLRRALAGAQSMAPCVLWIDEIDKALSVDHAANDDGVSRRVLGTLLTWLAERTKPVFIVATANDLLRLPPELVRKGRLDEIFFVDLPGAAARRQILAIHLRKRRLDAAAFDLDALVEHSTGFSGAELEQAVVAAGFNARAGGTPLGDAELLAELGRTRPLSVVMAEKLNSLRAWARERAVFADDPEEEVSHASAPEAHRAREAQGA